jgi:hypothetical protein
MELDFCRSVKQESRPIFAQSVSAPRGLWGEMRGGRGAMRGVAFS